MIKGIIIEPSAKNSLITETSKFKAAETGGVLCGYYKDEYLVIESVSGPGPNALHSIDEFVMDKGFMDVFLDKEYLSSAGKYIYIGEWHTHPQIYPKPSDQDIKSIVERSFEWQHGEIVFLIIGFLRFTATKLEEQIIGLNFDKEKGKIWQLPVKFL